MPQVKKTSAASVSKANLVEKEVALLKDENKKLLKEVSELKKLVESLAVKLEKHDHPQKAVVAQDKALRAGLIKFNPKIARYI